MASLVKKHRWYEWLCHSNFSFLTGSSHPHEYVNRAIALGYQGIGITDLDGVYGIVRAWRALNEKIKQEQTSLHLSYGAEFHMAAEHHLPLLFRDTCVLIAQNMAGYSELCQLINESHRKSKTKGYLPLSTLLNHNTDHLLCFLPMRGLIRRNEHKQLSEKIALLKDKFGDRLNLVISRHLSPCEDCWITPTLDLSKEFTVPYIMSQDPWFHDHQQKDLNDLVHGIRNNQTVDQAVSHMFANGERSLRAKQSLHWRYHNIPGYEMAMVRSDALMHSCQFRINDLHYQYPKEMIPHQMNAQEYLEVISWRSAKERFQPLPDKLAQTIQKELKLIQELNFADYFLTVWDIVNWARQQNILCQGRGSAANSAVCFVLGITAVDPSLFDLLFERFISLERGDPPDIDVDFEHERREEVIQYIYSRYGRSKAAMVANVITFKSRGAIRFTGKALGVPETILSQASVLQETRIYRRENSPACLKKLKEQGISEKMLNEIPWKIWGAMAERLKGFPRHMGVHSGGFIISHQDLHHLSPQEPATMKGRTVLQWSKEDIEALQLFKIDILALGMLTVIRKSFRYISDHYNQNFSLDTIPQEDPKTYQMIQQAKTVGTFQIESRAQMSMLPRLLPKTFYDLVIQVGIIRPGPIQGGLIHPFLRRRHGLEPIIYPDPKLEPILKRTMGVPIFQEQVMRIAIAVGDFTPGEADSLRRHLGSWSMGKDFTPLITRLAEGMRSKGMAETFVQQILGQLKGFADYGFPESHAASFALLAYGSSWLKCHFPAAFFTALLNSQPMGFYSPHALITNAKREGVAIFPICVQSSQWCATMEKSQQGHWGIRLGLNMVRGLKQDSAHLMVAQRKEGGPWHNILDFLRRSELYRGDLTALAAADTLKTFGADRRCAIWLAEAAPFAALMEDNDLVHHFGKEEPLEKSRQDFQYSGTSLGDHPTKIIKEHHWCFRVKPQQIKLAADIPKLIPNQVIHVFGMVLVRQAPPSAKGMVFLTLDDESGFLNLVFTPQIYERYQELINSQGFLCAEGKLQTINEGHSIMVKRILAPTITKADVIPMHAENYSLSEIREQRNLILDRARNYM